jgi:hypothetical protein
MAQKRILLGSVGYRGDNRSGDVALVTELLNGVPARLGGPETALAPTSPRDMALGCNVELMNAIGTFQKRHFGWAAARLGRESATLYRLFHYSAAGDNGHAPITVIPGGRRSEIIDEARKWVGKVSDKLGKGESTRRGWEILKKIFDETFATPIDWSGTAKRKFHSEAAKTDYMVTNLEGVKVPGMRVPQDDQGRGLNWCGIFGTWVWRNTKMEVLWKPGDGPILKGSTDPITRSRNPVALMPGDICAIPQANHHFIVVSVSANLSSMASVDGNTDWQQIEEFKDKHKVAEMNSFISVDTAMDSTVRYPKK